MNKGYLTSFIAGGVIFGVISHILTKIKCNKEKYEELAEQRAFFSEKIKQINRDNHQDLKEQKEYYDKKISDSKEESKKSDDTLENFVKSRGYYDYSTKISDLDKSSAEDKMNHISVYLSQEEFANSEYECLTYYYDGMRFYDFDRQTDVNLSFLGDLDIDELFVNSNYEDIYIRNDLLECDYEIRWQEEREDKVGEGDDS